MRDVSVTLECHHPLSGPDSTRIHWFTPKGIEYLKLLLVSNQNCPVPELFTLTRRENGTTTDCIGFYLELWYLADVKKFLDIECYNVQYEMLYGDESDIPAYIKPSNGPIQTVHVGYLYPDSGVYILNPNTLQPVYPTEQKLDWSRFLIRDKEK